MKLLNKTIRSYLVYSLSILLITIPLFYFVVRSVLLHAVDRSLKNQLREIRANLNLLHSQEELETWSRLDKDILLSPVNINFPDEVYTTYKFNRRHNEREPYREIAGVILVGNNKYKLIINSSLVENEDLLGSILLVQTIFLILLMTGLLWINRLISKKLWQPFYIALNNMQQFELNKNGNLVFKENNTDEFKALNDALKNLFKRSHAMYIQQREFTENASHEMQTPLAIFQGKLELLMQTEPLTEEQAALITAIETTNLRLVKLNKSLLLLAKIENEQFKPLEEVNIEDLTRKIIQQFRDHADSMKLSIEESYMGRLVPVANQMLVEILISNLLSNAIRHNQESGKIIVSVDNRTFTIKNKALNKRLDPEKLFERFQKGDNTSANREGTGLGLAIAKKICVLMRYRIDYSYENDWHCFTVYFFG